MKAGSSWRGEYIEKQGSICPAQDIQISGYKYLHTNICIQIFGYKYLDTNIWIQIFGYKYLDTNIWIQISAYKYLHTNIWIQISAYKCLDTNICTQFLTNATTGKQNRPTYFKGKIAIINEVYRRLARHSSSAEANIIKACNTMKWSHKIS